MSTPPPLTRTLTDLNAWRARWLAARDHPDAYWLERTRALLSWHTPPTIGCEGDFWSVQEAPLRWFADGRLNVSYECLDRHLPARADQTAIIWEADEPGQHRHITYAELHAQVFEKVRCGDCARCCKTISPIFTDRDIPKVARAVGLRPADFTEKYLRLDEDQDYVLKSSPCPFLAEDNSCMIYDDRPKACREYPHTDSHRLRQLLDITERNVEVCPAAYEVVERVAKRLLGVGFEEETPSGR